MKVIIKSSFALLLLTLLGSCATGNTAVTNSPDAPLVAPQTTTEQTPAPPQEEKTEVRSSEAVTVPAYKIGITSSKAQSVKNTIK